jgi:hypothetical protein
MERRSRAVNRAAAWRPSAGFLALAGLVIVGGVVVRLALLGRQSYWIDELFSVNESAGTLRSMVKVGSTEVHTPLYAGLLWAWVKLGDTHEVWTRLLSTLCAVTSVAVTHRGLRGIRLSDQVRWALTAATAASGTSIIYSLETRNYALLLLGSVGLTAATLRAALLTLDGEVVRRRTYLAWTGWAALAATAHLFGAVLTIGATTVLVVVTLYRGPSPRAGRAVTWVVLAVAGCSFQGAWLLLGLRRPGFASGTSWIHAPQSQDVWDLVTTTFSSGGISAHKDGFAWTSPIGVVLVAGLCVAAALSGYLGRRRPAAATAEVRAATILLTLATIVTVAVFGISQWKHLWTLRNMVIVSPALLWGAICLAAAAARTAAGRRQVAAVVVALLGVSLAATTIGAAAPYKTDFRGLFEYLIAERARQPDSTYVFFTTPSGPSPPGEWQTASDRPPDDPAWRTLYRRITLYPEPSQNVAIRISDAKVVTFYHGMANPHFDAEVAVMIARLGPRTCRRIPIYGLGVVQCG